MKRGLPAYEGKDRPGRALIVEGGGMRGAFVGGALSMMAKMHPASEFDLVVGVSAGSCSAAYYVADKEANAATITQTLNIWRHELTGRRLMSFWNFVRGRRFLDHDFLIDLFRLKYPMRTETFDEKGRTPLYVAVTNLDRGHAEFVRADSQNVYSLLRAATALPIATRGTVRFGGALCSDGGVLEPLPVQAVIDAGYRDLTVILTNPRKFRSEPVGRWVSRLAFRKHPLTARQLAGFHHVQYNRSYELVNNPPPGVRVRIIDPPRLLPAGMIDTAVELVNRAVDMGQEAARAHYAAFQRDHLPWPSRLKRLLQRWRARIALA